MTERAATDRRALRAPLSDAPPTRLRMLAATLHAGLYRPLAEDDTRAAYWVRHVRIGVLLTEVAALTVVGYVLLTDSPARNSPVLLALAGLAIVAVPGLLLLPLPAMMRDSRGPTMLYAWSLGTRLEPGDTPGAWGRRRSWSSRRDWTAARRAHWTRCSS